MAYTTPALLKTYVGVGDAGDDVLLTSLINAAQKYIEDDRGYAFEASADVARKFTVGKDTEGRELYLDAWLCQITSIVTNADATVPVTLLATEYVTHPRNYTPYHAIELLWSSNNTWTYTTNPQNGIVVTGRWAWSLTAPADIIHACNRLAAYFYRQKDAGVYDVTAIPDAGIIQIPQGIPADVAKILNTYPKGYGG
jgi:hypothetical protein